MGHNEKDLITFYLLDRILKKFCRYNEISSVTHIRCLSGFVPFFWMLEVIYCFDVGKVKKIVPTFFVIIEQNIVIITWKYNFWKRVVLL